MCWCLKTKQQSAKVAPDFSGIHPEASPSSQPSHQQNNGTRHQKKEQTATVTAAAPQPEVMKASLPSAATIVPPAAIQAGGSPSASSAAAATGSLPPEEVSVDILPVHPTEPAASEACVPPVTPAALEAPITPAAPSAPAAELHPTVFSLQQAADCAHKVVANPAVVDKMPEIPSVNDVAPGHYGVELHRDSAKQRWGFIWDAQALEKRSVRVLEKVPLGSIAAEWNCANPGREARPGDTLVKVNGQSGRLEKLTLELSRNHIMCEFQPGEPRPVPEPYIRPNPIVSPLPAADQISAPSTLKPVPTHAVKTELTESPSSVKEIDPNIGSQGSTAVPVATPAHKPIASAAVSAGSELLPSVFDIAPGHYGVELKRSAATQQWGFTWDSLAMEKKGIRIVEKISPNSLVAQWNLSHGEDVRLGDELVKVNGRSGRMEAMTMELRKNHVVCEFRPAQPRAQGQPPAVTIAPKAITTAGGVGLAAALASAFPPLSPSAGSAAAAEVPAGPTIAEAPPLPVETCGQEGSSAEPLN